MNSALGQQNLTKILLSMSRISSMFMWQFLHDVAITHNLLLVLKKLPSVSSYCFLFIYHIIRSLNHLAYKIDKSKKSKKKKKKKNGEHIKKAHENENKNSHKPFLNGEIGSHKIYFSSCFHHILDFMVMF